MRQMKKDDRDFLFRLLETPSPTGFEMPGQRVWAERMRGIADEVECDSYGSTWAKLKGTTDRQIMLAAHADEIGYMIKYIQKDGFIRIDRIGGSDAATARGRKLRFFGDKGEVLGVIGNTAIHLRRDTVADEKVPAAHELWVDVGVSSAEEVAELGLRVGIPAVYTDGPYELGNKRIVSRAIDNRIGGYIIAKVMENVAKKKKRPAFTLVCLNAVQEEIGGNGAMIASYKIFPDACVCLDVTHATDTPGIDPTKHGLIRLGGGPAVTHGTVNQPLLVKRLMDVAKKEKIKIQHEATSRTSGTDTDKIMVQRGGIASALVSLPLRSMHSVVETAHLDDIEGTIDLLTGLVLSLEEGDSFHHKL
jgi:putative aminopeptidase FrvX